MKKILLIALFIAGKVGLAQSFELRGTDTINYTDANNLRQGYWVVTNKIKKLPNCPEDTKIEEGTYVDGKKSGKWINYNCSGHIKNELIYVNNRPSGYAKFYYDNGNIMEEGQWENNRWVGEHKFYYESGKMSYTWNHNATGKREGQQKYYHENGKVMIEGDWKEGKESGVIKEYYEDGSLKSEKSYADGTFDPAASKTYEPKTKAGSNETAPKEEVKTEPVKETVGIIKDGYNKTYSAPGKVDKEGTFKSGQLIDGKKYIYEGDQVVKVIIFKNGMKAGEEQPK